MRIGKVEPSGRPVIWTSLKLGPDLIGHPSGSTFPILTMTPWKILFMNLHFHAYFHCPEAGSPILPSVFLFLVPGTGKSHQNTSAGKFDPEQAVWNCWLLALFNDVIICDVTTHNATLPATSPPLSMALNVINFNKSILKSGDTMLHASLGYASTGICDIVSPSTEIFHSGTDTRTRFYTIQCIPHFGYFAVF